MNEYISISQAKSLLQGFETISKPSLFVHLEEGRIPGIRTEKKWLIETSYVLEAYNWRKHSYTAEECIQKYNGLYPDQSLTPHDRNQLVRKDRELRSDSAYQYLFCGKYFIEEEKIGDYLLLIEEQLGIRHFKETAIPIKSAAEMMGTNHYRLLKAINSNKISAFISNNQWFLKKETVNEYNKNRFAYICVLDTAVRLSQEIHTIFDPNDRHNRAQLNRYLRSSTVKNYIFTAEECGIIYEEKRLLFYPAEHAKEIEAIIASYIRTFGNSDEKLKLYDSLSWSKQFPHTKSALYEYCENKKDTCLAIIQNILIHSQTKEIMDYTNEELSIITADAERTQRKSAKDLLLRFLNYVRVHYDCIYTKEFFANEKGMHTKKANIFPYTEYQFIEVGRLAFSNERIDEIIDKSIKNARLSYTWYYTQMHYVGALRKSDIESSMPIISLPYSCQETIQRIKEGNFDEDAIRLSIRFESEVNQSLILPHKTREKQKQRALIIKIPTSLRKSFGICYAIYCFHRQTTGNFNTFLKKTQFIKLFGEKYRAIIGESVFLNRRANKSYLDYIAQDVEKQHGVNSQIMGYAVAQFSRAHVRGSETTNKYLTTQLDGLSIDEITKLLFETGTCSFIPHYLLQIIYGEKYSKVPVDVQNNTIIASNLSPFKAEKLTQLLDDAFERSKAAVKSIMKGSSQSNQKNLSKLILSNLINRTALGKQAGINCLLAARRLPCAYLGRECAGCIYGIYETSFFYMAIDYVKKQYGLLSKAKTPGEMMKWQKIIDCETLPSMCEIISIAETTYEMDISDYKNMLLEIITSKGDSPNVALEI